MNLEDICPPNGGGCVGGCGCVGGRGCVSSCVSGCVAITYSNQMIGLTILC